MPSLFRTLSLVTPALLVLGGCDRPPSGSQSAAIPPANESAPRAPDVFSVRFETSRGAFTVEAHRDWAPRGVDRFHQLVTSGYYDNNRFFRVIPKFVVQFGMHGDPAVTRTWEPLAIPDDSVVQSNRRGTVTFATGGPNTRTTQLFINLADNLFLDAMGFSPIGLVSEGMDVVDNIYGGYGDEPPNGNGPAQARIASEGNAYLEREFPQLDFIRTARVVPAVAADSARGGG